MPENELDKLAHRAYLADMLTERNSSPAPWEDLEDVTRQRYRAMAHAVRVVSTSGFMTAPELEHALMASLDTIGVQISRDERAIGMAKYDWSIEKLGLSGYAETFGHILNQIISELMAGYTPF